MNHSRHAPCLLLASALFVAFCGSSALANELIPTVNYNLPTLNLGHALSLSGVMHDTSSGPPPFPNGGQTENVPLSRYISTTDATAMYNMGCADAQYIGTTAGGGTAVAIFDFGPPYYYKPAGATHPEYGTLIFVPGSVSASFRSINDIQTAIEDYMTGFINQNCNPGFSYFWSFGIGTNNCTYGASSDCTYNPKYTPNYVAFGHGSAWGKLVANLQTFAQSPYYYPSFGYAPDGASDAELDWNSYANTSNWVSGYTKFATGSCTPTPCLPEPWPWLDYGDAAGCPDQILAKPGACNNSWNQADFYKLSSLSVMTPYGMNITSFTEFVPENYDTSGENALQWTSAAVINHEFHPTQDPIWISSILTQFAACQSNGCPNGTNNDPIDSWNELTGDLYNQDTQTQIYLKNFLQVIPPTDITWAN